MNKKELRALNQVANQPDWVRSQIIKIWNHDHPHFGGDAGHRYDGRSQYCAYCNRPKNWKPRNVFFNDDGTVAKLDKLSG